MARAEITIRMLPGEPRTGLWCARCLLPSRVEIDLWWLRPDGLHLIGTGTACLDGACAEDDPPSTSGGG